ncbi:hypothetical protein JKP88DRAFT_348277 [Tribonema minus]|uniref:Uncharacterized protein n=1 Tax=Tribonema minus TaxID=303371 RepID=A0A835Z0K6_9STRA|nr:hypothetical protein JKP88DRAFT_348277 [Tribonema minus]
MKKRTSGDAAAALRGDDDSNTVVLARRASAGAELALVMNSADARALVQRRQQRRLVTAEAVQRAAVAGSPLPPLPACLDLALQCVTYILWRDSGTMAESLRLTGQLAPRSLTTPSDTLCLDGSDGAAAALYDGVLRRRRVGADAGPAAQQPLLRLHIPRAIAAPHIVDETATAAAAAGDGDSTSRGPPDDTADASASDGDSEAGSPEPRLSDIDAAVLRELMQDQEFMSSVAMKEGLKQQLDGLQDEYAAAAGGKGAGAAAGEYSSATFQIFEGLSLGWGTFVAKVGAAVETAAIAIQNKVQVDINTVLGVTNAIVQRATYDARRTLAAAATAARPDMLLAPARNVTRGGGGAAGGGAAPPALDLGLGFTLLQLGVNPFEEVNAGGAAPELLDAFKGFEDEDARLRAAYARGKRKRNASLPEASSAAPRFSVSRQTAEACKLLGALPAAVGAADDLAYAVEQEVRYEKPGRRTTQVLRRVGIPLSGAAQSALGGGSAAGVARALPSGGSSSSAAAAAAEATEPPASAAAAGDDDDDGGSLRDAGEAGAGEAAAAAGVVGAVEGEWLFAQMCARPALLLEEVRYCLQRACLALGLAARADSGGGGSAEAAAAAARDGSAAARMAATVEARLLRELTEIEAAAAAEGRVKRELSAAAQERARLSEQQQAVAAALDMVAGALERHGAAIEAATPRAGGVLSQLEELQETLAAVTAVTTGATQGERDHDADEAAVTRAASALALMQALNAAVAVPSLLLTEARSRVTAALSLLATVMDESSSQDGGTVAAVLRAWLAGAEGGGGAPLESLIPALRLEYAQQQQQQRSSAPGTAADGTGAAPAAAAASAAAATAATANADATAADTVDVSAAPFQRATTAEQQPSAAAAATAAPRQVYTPDAGPAAAPQRSTGAAPPRAAAAAAPAPAAQDAVFEAVVVEAEWSQAGGVAFAEAPRAPPAAVEDVLEGELVMLAEMEDADAGVVDLEAGDVEEVEDGAATARKATLKTLDVIALLVEKTLFIALPALLTGGALAARRAREAAAPEGEAGWRLLSLLKRTDMGRSAGSHGCRQVVLEDAGGGAEAFSGQCALAQAAAARPTAAAAAAAAALAAEAADGERGH